MHLFRTNYQAAIWKCCLHALPTLPDPTKRGWVDDDGKLDRHSLDAVATSTICCLGSVGLQVCPFLQADTVYVHGKYIACTDMCCKLQSCSNQKQQEDEDDIVDLGYSDDDKDGQVDV